jgi:hypothetical protein
LNFPSALKRGKQQDDEMTHNPLVNNYNRMLTARVGRHMAVSVAAGMLCPNCIEVVGTLFPVEQVAPNAFSISCTVCETELFAFGLAE